jgi:hypothetical protein
MRPVLRDGLGLWARHSPTHLPKKGLKGVSTETGLKYFQAKNDVITHIKAVKTARLGVASAHPSVDRIQVSLRTKRPILSLESGGNKPASIRHWLEIFRLVQWGFGPEVGRSRLTDVRGWTAAALQGGCWLEPSEWPYIDRRVKVPRGETQDVLNARRWSYQMVDPASSHMLVSKTVPWILAIDRGL